MRKTPPWLGAERGLKDMVVEHLNHNSRRGQRLVQGGNTSSLIASADLEQPMDGAIIFVRLGHWGAKKNPRSNGKIGGVKWNSSVHQQANIIAPIFD